MSTMNVVIVSAEGQVFAGDAEMVVAPASMGEVGIAPRHAPLLTTLKPGEVRIKGRRNSSTSRAACSRFSLIW
jgi:F-type H+-transporting ATPase subunit epsilon